MEDIQLKFLFANRDGVKVTLKIHKEKYVADLKKELMEQWPAGTHSSLSTLTLFQFTHVILLSLVAIQKPESISMIRLICMGLGVLQDTKTLTECKIPVFPTHPTPINVSILPPKAETESM